VPNQESFQAWLLSAGQRRNQGRDLGSPGIPSNPILQSRLGFVREDRRTTETIRLLYADPKLTGF
jgi:hypothetical protein